MALITQHRASHVILKTSGAPICKIKAPNTTTIEDVFLICLTANITFSLLINERQNPSCWSLRRWCNIRLLPSTGVWRQQDVSRYNYVTLYSLSRDKTAAFNCTTRLQFIFISVGISEQYNVAYGEGNRRRVEWASFSCQINNV